MARKTKRRLSRSAEFDRVYRRGRSATGRFAVLYGFEREHAISDRPLDENSATEDHLSVYAADDSIGLGVSVGRRVGPAATRNQVKRLVREAFWALQEKLLPGYDYVVVARTEAGQFADNAGLEGFKKELSDLIDKMGSEGAG